MEIICEHDTVTNEHTILNSDTFTDERMARYLAILSDDRIALNFDKCPNARTGPNPTPVQIHEIWMVNNDSLFEDYA